jgi:hypothetical protein
MSGRMLIWLVSLVVALCCVLASSALADGKFVVETPSGLKAIETSVQPAKAKLVATTPLTIRLGETTYECGFEITGGIAYEGENFKLHRQLDLHPQLELSDCQSDVGPFTLAIQQGQAKMKVFTNGSADLAAHRPAGSKRSRSLLELTAEGVTCTYGKGRFHMTFPLLAETPLLLTNTVGKLALEKSVTNPPGCAKKGTVELGPLAFYAETPETEGFHPVVLTQKTAQEIGP